MGDVAAVWAFTGEVGCFYSRSSRGERRMPGDAWRSPVVPGDATGQWAASMAGDARQCGSFGIDSRGNRGDEDDEAARR